MQQIQLNIIPFTPTADKLSLAFYSQKTEGLSLIKWDNKLFNEFPKGRLADNQNNYSDFQSEAEGAFSNFPEFRE
jgi:hypothetical protein